MRQLVRVLVAATSVLAVFYPASTSSANNADGDAAYVEELLFHTRLTDFVAIAAGRVGPDGVSGNAWFDWSNDGCSAPGVGNTGRTFDFTNACIRHDFGYRNSHLLQRRYGDEVRNGWGAATRERIDRQFLTDMKHHCHHRWLPDRPTCYSWAYTFYSAVRIAGGP